MTERYMQSLAKSAKLRKELGLANRRAPGRLPSSEAKAFARIVAETELTPDELISELHGALIDHHASASLLEMVGWRDPGIRDRETRPSGGDVGACAITKGSEVSRGE